MRSKTLSLLAFLLAFGAHGQTLNEYLSKRAEHGLRQPSSVEVLPSAPFGTVLEIAGRVSGIAKSAGGESCLVEVEGQTLVVRSVRFPDWLGRGSRSIRMLVRVEGGGFGMPELSFVAAVPEADIGAYEEAQRKAEEQAKAHRARATTENAKKERFPEQVLATIEAILPGYKSYIKGVNPRLSDWEAEQIARSLLVFSAKHGVDPRLVTAVVVCESGFRPSATSPKGAAGLGQLMPSTAQGMGVRNPYDTNQNLEATVRLLRGHMLKYKPPGEPYVDIRTLATALAAYNAGSGAVRRHGGIPPYRETRAYISRVISLYRRLCGE